MFVEELFDLLLVAVKDVYALSVKLWLNRLKLLVVVLSHLCELGLHACDECINVLWHLLDRLDVMTVLLVDLLFELFNQLLLVGDDLRAGRLLCLNVLLLTKNLIVSKSVIAPEVQIRGKLQPYNERCPWPFWLTSASSLQSSFSSSSCQFQSISTFFLCDWITSFWISLALFFLFFSSRVRRFLSSSSVSVFI